MKIRELLIDVFTDILKRDNMGTNKCVHGIYGNCAECVKDMCDRRDTQRRFGHGLDMLKREQDICDASGRANNERDEYERRKRIIETARQAFIIRIGKIDKSALPSFFIAHAINFELIAEKYLKDGKCEKSSL